MWGMGVSKNSDHIQIKIKMLNPSQEPPAPPKAPHQGLKDNDVLCTFKIQIDNQNFGHGCLKEQQPYPNQDEDAKSKSGTSTPHQSPKLGLNGHGYSLHLQNHDREPKFGTWVNKRPMPISKERSR